LQRRKIRTRLPELTAALAAAVILGGCGAAEQPRSSPLPRLQRSLASSLAAQSDRIASALDAGDSCGAHALAQRLQQQTIEAINAGRVPRPLQETLQGSVNQLAAHIVCTVEEPAKKNEHKKDRRHKHKGKKGEGGD
jgi:hypothetical protein